jgi:hypothetical protein
MVKVFELREKPELKLILKDLELDIIDKYSSHNNGSYSYNNIVSVHLQKKRTQWFISVLSIIVDIFSGSAMGGKFQNKAQLNIELKTGKSLTIWLIDTDFELIKEAAQSITAKINSY